MSSRMRPADILEHLILKLEARTMPSPPRRTVGKSDDGAGNSRFVDRDRSLYAVMGVVLFIMMNSISAIALLVGLAHGAASGQNLKSFANAMMVFGVGAAAGLASIFFAYLRRLLRLERPLQDTTPLRWLAIAAAIARSEEGRLGE